MSNINDVEKYIKNKNNNLRKITLDDLNIDNTQTNTNSTQTINFQEKVSDKQMKDQREYSYKQKIKP